MTLEPAGGCNFENTGFQLCEYKMVEKSTECELHANQTDRKLHRQLWEVHQHSCNQISLSAGLGVGPGDVIIPSL